MNILPDNQDHARFIQSTLVPPVYRRVVDMGGVIAAEHGIGPLKKDYLGIQWGRDEIEQMIAIKRALDPSWRLNPGKIL